MNPERWRRVEELYNAALDLHAGERAGFLHRACGEDDALRREVESLLAAHEGAGSFIVGNALNDRAVTLTEAPAHRIGQSIHQYKIISAIGKGGMGEVWLAEDTRLHRKVALKLLPAEFAGDADRVRRFEQEARAVTALNHPNIVTLFDLGQSGDDYFMATEYVDGRTLREHLIGRGKLPAGEAIALVTQIADALAAAHEAGIVHRDIKPENVMLRRDGYVKVLDFGLAKIGGSFGGEASSITEAGAVMGTVSYMSPEQARGLRVDARTDVFSLGVVLYEMLAGRTPFDGATASDMIASILRAEANPIADAPEELNRIVMKSLAKECDARYPGVADFARELKALSRELDFQERRTDARESGRERQVVTAVTAEAPPANITASTGARPWPRRFAMRKYLFGAAAAGVALAAFVRFLPQSSGNFESEILPNLKNSPVISWKTELDVNTLLLDVSPNGAMIAFSKGQNAQTDIFVKQLNGGEPHQVTDDPWLDSSPIWSPDGQQLAYLSLRNGRWEVWLVPFLTGSGRLVKTLPTFPLWLTRWSKDGARIFYEAEDNFFALDVHSGETFALTNFPAGKKHFSISKDETWLAYDETIGDVSHIVAAPLAGGAPVQVTKEGEANLYPVWLPDGERIVYSSKRNGIHQICIAWLDGRKPVQLTFGPENLTPWDISPSGREIFYVADRKESDLFLYDVEARTERPLSADIMLDLYPAFSPAGKAIVYQQIDAGDNLFSGTIFARELDGGRSTRLPGNGFDPRWSPDGNRLAFMRYAGRSYELWAVRKDGADERLLVKGSVTFNGFSQQSYSWVQPNNFAWSPDSGRIAYSSNQSKLVNIKTIAIDGGAETAVSNNTDKSARLLSPIWSPDGKRLAWLREYAEEKIRKYGVDLWDAGNVRTIHQSDLPLRMIGWAASGKQLLVAEAEAKALFVPNNFRLLRIFPDRGTAESAGSFISAYFHSLTLSSDGGEVLFVSRNHDRDEIWLASLENVRRRKLMSNADAGSFVSGVAWSPDRNLICFTRQSNFNSIWMIENLR